MILNSKKDKKESESDKKQCEEYKQKLIKKINDEQSEIKKKMEVIKKELNKLKLRNDELEKKKKAIMDGKKGYPDVSYAVDVFFGRIWDSYKMSSDKENFLEIKDFLQDFCSLSKEEFIEDLKCFNVRKHEFGTIYFLVNGYDNGVKVLLNSEQKINPEHMREYVAGIQKLAINRLDRIIKRLDKLMQDNKKVFGGKAGKDDKLLDGANDKTEPSDGASKKEGLVVKLQKDKDENSNNLKKQIQVKVIIDSVRSCCYSPLFL